jgi:hypothetical protein
MKLTKVVAFFMAKLMAMEFEQRKLIATACNGLALMVIGQLFFVRTGILNAMFALITTILLWRVAIIILKKREDEK